MEKNSKGNPFVNLIIILVFGWIIYLIITEDSRSQKKRDIEDSQFPKIENYRKEFKGRLVKIKGSGAYAGRKLLYFSNGQKAAINSNTFNYAISRGSLMSFIQVGDSIYKPANRDTVYIYRGSKTYYFRTGIEINKK